MVKIPVPKKLVIVLSGVVVLGGGTGATAFFIGRDAILGPSAEELAGVECTDVVRVADMRKDRGPWLRKYVRVEAGTDGLTRVKTAIRVATEVQKTLPADLIEIAIIDENGPDKRAFMRGRAVGAEVILVKDPNIIPGIDSNFTVRYFEGQASGTGMFYGKEQELTSEEAEALAAKMEELSDCAPPPGTETANAESKASSGHGGAKTEGETTGHGEAPADSHGDAAPAEGDTTAQENGGLLSSVMGMVGLGGSEEPVAQHGDTATKDAQGDTSGHGKLIPIVRSAPADHSQPTTNHAATAPEPAGTSAEESEGVVSKMLGFVGLGGKKEDEHLIEHSGGPSIFSGKSATGDAPSAENGATEKPKANTSGH